MGGGGDSVEAVEFWWVEGVGWWWMGVWMDGFWRAFGYFGGDGLKVDLEWTNMDRHGQRGYS